MKFCPLYSGSSGNSIFFGEGEDKILIDVGLPGKKIDIAMSEIDEDTSNIKGIFITHEHSDHIKGVGVLSRKYNIPIYANELTWQAMYGKIGKIKDENIKTITKSVEIGNILVEPFKTSHDAADSCGYIIHSGNKKTGIATDLGILTEDVQNKIKDCEIILLECNHDVEMLKFGPYPYVLKRRILSDFGHISNEACGEGILKIFNGDKKHIYLGHLSKTNNHPDLAYKTVEVILEAAGIRIGHDINLIMTNRDKISKVINL